MQSSNLTIVMYHYVRPIKDSKYPNIKGRELHEFKFQLDWLCANYDIVSMEDCNSFIFEKSIPPARPLLLTFDDGYSDHYNFVYPELKKRGLQGSFFIPAKPILEPYIMDVNKIHFILEKSEIFDELEYVIENYVKLNSDHHDIKPISWYRSTYRKAAGYDNSQVIYIKRMLQHALPADLRSVVIDDLFKKIVSSEIEKFNAELYLKIDQINEMLEGGMHIGGHGYNHHWLSLISPESRKEEIERSSSFIKSFSKPNVMSFCYPYGDFCENTIEHLANQGYHLAFTTKPEIADLKKENNLTMSRLDTNEFPVA
ncbi:MAG: polysaccharide deacetylase family protein [Oligoflexales bacterium]